MTKRLPLAGALAGVRALAAVPAAAHHGTSITYFVDKSITLTGVVTELVYGYCVASEEQRFNRLIRDGGVGK